MTLSFFRTLILYHLNFKRVLKHRKTEALMDSGEYTDSENLDSQGVSQEGLVPCINGPCVKNC